MKIGSPLFSTKNCNFIKDYGYLYFLSNRLLKIKRTRVENNTLDEVIIYLLFYKTKIFNIYRWIIIKTNYPPIYCYGIFY